MLVEIPPKMSVVSFMGFLKGKSSLIIHERHANLKYKHGNRSFWCRVYYVDTAGKNTKKIAEYIQNQLKEDKLQDQLTFREYEDPCEEPSCGHHRPCDLGQGADHAVREAEGRYDERPRQEKGKEH